MNFVSRAGNMISRPHLEWRVIAAEPRGVLGPCVGYVAVMAAIPLAAEMLGRLDGGVPLRAAAGLAASGYLLALLDVALLALVASLLAPRFGGRGDLAQGFKLAAFGCTPAWLGGVLVLVPGIGAMLALAATFYGVYVFYLGIPALTGVPARRQLGYFVLVLAVTFALAIAAALALTGASGFWDVAAVHR